MSTYVRAQNIEHVIGLDGKADLRVTDADVRLRAAAGDTARLRITFEISTTTDAEADRIVSEAGFDVQTDGGWLTVQQRHTHGRGDPLGLARLFGGDVVRAISVDGELPAGTRLSLEAVSSDVEAIGFTGSQRYQTTSGDVRLVDVAGSAQLKTVSGDLTIRAQDPFEGHVESVSGDISIVSPRLRGLQVTAVSGDVAFESMLDPGEYRIQTVSGDLSVGLAGAATFDVRGLSTDIDSEIDHRLEGSADRRRLIIGSGGPSVVFQTMSGDLSVHRARRIEVAVPPPAAPAPTSTQSSIEVLRALERGEIDVDEAARRLDGS